MGPYMRRIVRVTVVEFRYHCLQRIQQVKIGSGVKIGGCYGTGGVGYEYRTQPGVAWYVLCNLVGNI